MAGRGPAPKAVRSRSNDTARREAEVTEVEADGELYGPELPEGVLPDGASWHPRTVALWDSLRSLPLLKNELDLGWEFLLDTALMHHTMWSKGRWEFASEVRLRLAKFGATPEDRMRLKIKVTTPTDETKRPAQAGPGSVSDIASRRARLSGT
jgi:hypothetical protein